MTREHFLDGVTVPWIYDELEAEVRALRSGIAVSLLPHVQAIRLAGPGAAELMERLVPCELYVHDGQMKHTLLLDAEDRPLADVYVCADGDDYLLISEGLPKAELEALLASKGGEVEVERLTDSHAFVALNGPFAWELLAELEGPGAIGFPYLTFYRPQPDRIYFRAGKTGEFGYELLVPKSEVNDVFAQLLERGRAFDARRAGVGALHHAALENWFFNIHREGRASLRPIELQLQWRVSYEKIERRVCKRRITAIRADAAIHAGDPVFCGAARIGEVLVAERSVTLDAEIGIALLDVEYAQSGIDRYRANGARLATVSAPFVNNLSLHVNVYRDRYARRGEIKFPGFSRR